MKLSDLCKALNLDFKGKDKSVISLNDLVHAKEDEISYAIDEKHLKALENTKAGVLILSEKFISHVPKNASIILSDEANLTMAYISKYFHDNAKMIDQKPKISPKAQIDLNVTIQNGSFIDEDVKLCHGVFVGQNVRIGKGSIIHPNVVIYDNTIIGENCTILANAVIGSDGFGYAHTKFGKHVKIYHSGHVELENDVDIGAGTTIDRGVFGKTLIKKGTKIDNLVQIGHNCELGEDCIVVAQVGLAGSSKLGVGVIMGGQSATSGHISIGDRAVIAARGGVSKNLKGGQTYSGFPIMIHKEWLYLQAKLAKFFKSNKGNSHE